MTIKFNFTGGIISPGDLKKILLAAQPSGITHASFGLRQQLLIDVPAYDFDKLNDRLSKLEIGYEIDLDNHPNIISSYPAEEVFIAKTWLGEGVYKDIFDSFDYKPTLKINISNNHQSFTPLLTGNINWVASNATHFWHLLIRFPKTNVIYEWDKMVYSNDVVLVSKKVEELILSNADLFIENEKANGDKLFELLKQSGHFNTQPVSAPVDLPKFMLPYYEGFNLSNNKYWLGIYRRNELFNVKFLLDVCDLCSATKIGQICSTPWKSLIIKGIEQKDRIKWDYILGKHQINVRHAANELNFQVEDKSQEGVKLKAYLLRFFNRDDVRSFGLCIGIKTRGKSEVFSSILVRRKPLFRIGGKGFFHLYDILCAKDFNPNERTGTIYSRNNLKWILPEQLRGAIISYYVHKAKTIEELNKKTIKKEVIHHPKNEKKVHQCNTCFTVYDEDFGDVDNNVIAGTPFNKLSENWCCPLCEGSKNGFKLVAVSALFVES